MKKSIFSKFIGVFLVATLTLFITDTFGRGSSGGGRSFNSSRSIGGSWGGSKSSGSSWGKSSTSKSSGSSWGSRTTAPKATSKSPSSSKTSSALSRQQKVTQKTTQLSAVKKQEAAKTSLSKMKSDPKIASQYKSTYATQPATRPEYIPQTYKSGGNTYNISYNSGYGGYGYMGPGGSWMMYDVMSDMAMYSYLSHRHPTYAYNESEIERSAQLEAEAMIKSGDAEGAADMLRERREHRSRAPLVIFAVFAFAILFGVIMFNRV